MDAYIITNSELVAIANAIRNKNSSNETFTLEQIPNAIATIGENIGSGAVVRTATNDKYIVNETKLIAIADAVRLKNGSSTQYLLSELPQAILDIVTVTYTISYYNGSTLLYQETVPAGSSSSYSGTTPTKTSDAQYSYTFAGWSNGTDDNTVDSNALNNITEDRNVYACFVSTIRTYTVTFVRASADGGGTLQTLNNVDYGTTITAASSYTGSTPTTTKGSTTDYPFEGWNPASATVTGNTTFTAKFGSPVEVAEISDTWDQIIAKIDAGTYKTAYKKGNYKPLNLGTTEGTINMQIVAIDTDELAGGGYAPLTFIGMELLNTSHRMNPAKNSNTEGTGTIGGWEKSEMRTYLKNTIKPLIPSNVRSRINSVKKWSRIFDTSSAAINNSVSIDDVWIPSYKEVYSSNSSSYETSGPAYSVIYSNGASRMKTKASGSSAYWWIRSAATSSNFNYVTGYSGGIDSGASSNSGAVCLGFCLGLEPETITDDWSTILANQNYATDYSIGDTKYLDLGTEGKHLMEIVAINEDDRADGNGKAGLTWISKDLLATTHRMNPYGNMGTIGTGGAGGWENCEMRTYLKNTIKPLIPATVRNAIVEVTKIQSTISSGGSVIKNGQTSTEDVWIPSNHEIFGMTTYESTGPVYTSKFVDSASRVKKWKTGNGYYWWTRSARSMSDFRNVSTSGTDDYKGASFENNGVVLGFCTN